jgi:uncharacterized protein YndB with AHSA1/START domain
MSERSVEHATFAVERRYELPSDRVFAAWADREAKARWWGRAIQEHEFDFRVGGHELQRGIDELGNAYTFAAHYRDILPGERIVYTYEMLLEQTRISVSLATVEFLPEGSGTRLIFTEQGAFLDGHDRPARREHGMGSLLDALGADLRRG